jgi:hypothetical protein
MGEAAEDPPDDNEWEWEILFVSNEKKILLIIIARKGVTGFFKVTVKVTWQIRLSLSLNNSDLTKGPVTVMVTVTLRGDILVIVKMFYFAWKFFQKLYTVFQKKNIETYFSLYGFKMNSIRIHNSIMNLFLSIQAKVHQT